VVTHRNIKYRGTLPTDKWHQLLAESKFLLGACVVGYTWACGATSLQFSVALTLVRRMLICVCVAPRATAGLGDPLLGPSAIEAAAAGVMFINPVYRRPKRGYHSQHQFVGEQVGVWPCWLQAPERSHSSVSGCPTPLVDSVWYKL